MFEILSQPNFWISFLTLVVIVVSRYFPGFTLDTNTMAGYILVAISLIWKVAQDADIGPAGKWLRLIKSSEFVAAVVGLVLTTLYGFGINLGVSIEELVAVVVTIVGYIFGESSRKKGYRAYLLQSVLKRR